MKNNMIYLPKQQRGVSTLVITILLLVIMSLVVLFSTGVGFFEQRTASNEIRSRIAEQAAEVGISMGGEYIKSKRDLLIATTSGGWLSSGTGARWKSCSGISDTATLTDASGIVTAHPCRAERDTTGRRNQLYFFTLDNVGATTEQTYLPYGAINNVGGSAAFPSVVNVQALLCRIDSSDTPAACDSSPASGNRIAVTMIATATLAAENTRAVIKETWATYSTNTFGSSVPLVASGIVKGLGNSQIVTNPNAGGYGVAASMWSPNNIGFGTKSTNVCTDGSDNGAGGVGSSSTCQMEDYLFGTAFQASNVKTSCAPNGAKCKCPNIDGRYLSGHVAADKAEGIDILDIDSDSANPTGFGPLPDTTFFPGTSCTGIQRDDPNDGTDDSLFEWIFNADVVPEGVPTTKKLSDLTLYGTVRSSVRQDCVSGQPSPNDKDCAVAALINDLNAKSVTCAELNTLPDFNDGLYYVTDATGCTITRDTGSATQSVIVVVEESASLQANFFGLLFVRSKDNTAEVQVSGNNKIFGSMAVEGDIKITGTLDIVYDDATVNLDPTKLPKNAIFARVPGSWLDATEGF